MFGVLVGECVPEGIKKMEALVESDSDASPDPIHAPLKDTLSKAQSASPSLSQNLQQTAPVVCVNRCCQEKTVRRVWLRFEMAPSRV